MTPLRLKFDPAPHAGITRQGQAIPLGGFSGLRFIGATSSGLLQFVTHTDRGPNADEEQSPRGQVRPFALPSFQPRLIFLTADLRKESFYFRSQVLLRLPDGKPVSGLPPSKNNEIALDLEGREIGSDENGLDLEGVAIARDGSFWLCDEYAPSLVHFSPEGLQLERLMPGRAIPETLRYRRMNRGFEGIAIWEDALFAAMESPLDNPRSKREENSRRSRITRIIRLDLTRKITTAQYAYILEEADTGKISDICMEGPNTMIVTEKARDWIRLYRIELGNATNLQRLPSQISGPGGSLERMSAKELAAQRIEPVKKAQLLDLTKLGMREEKFEGVDRIDEETIALLTDNDFGLSGGIVHGNALAEMKNEDPALYIVPLGK